MATCIEWHKHDSAGSAEIGSNPYFTGGMSFPAGKFGNMAGLDGAYMVDYSSLATGDTFSLSFFWVPGYNNAGISTALLLSNQYGGDYVSIMYDSGLFQVEIAGSSHRYLFTPPSWSANQKLHIGLLFDPSESAGNKMKMYVDGSALSLYSAPGDTAWASTSHKFCFGEEMYGGAYSAYGGVDNPKIYSGLVTDSFAWDIANEGIYSPAGNVCYIIN